MLKVFQGFGRDQASDISGLSYAELRALTKHKIVTPKKTATGFMYSFQDLLMLRLISQLKTYGVRIKNVHKAHDYLKLLDPKKQLTNFKLYVRDDNKSILYLGENVGEEFMVSLDQYGQLVARGLLTIISVGKELEAVRQEVINLDRDLAKSLKSKKVYSLESLEKEYGIG